MGTRLLLPLTLFALCLSTSPSRLHSQTKPDESAKLAMHRTAEWQLVEPHLPNPASATPTQLQNAADVLRARRFYEDALDFYRYAIDRGGDVPALMNRMGVTELELRMPDAARAYFLRALVLQPRNPQYWNNVAAAEFLGGDVRTALRDYSRAVKLDKRNAVFHSNLGTAYFELKDYDSARKQFESAFRIDPRLYQRQDGAGIEARVFSPTDHGRFCFEIARLAALRHDDEDVVTWLTKASESGFDIRDGMSMDRTFDAYRNDPRVKIISQNARALRAGRTIATAPIPPLTQAPTQN